MAHKLSSAGGSTWAAGNVSLRLADALLEANFTSPVNASAIVARLFASWERVRVADCAALPAAANIVSYNQPACEAQPLAPAALVDKDSAARAGPTRQGDALLRCPFANYELYPSAHYKLRLELQVEPGGGRPAASIPVKTLEVSTPIARTHSVCIGFIHSEHKNIEVN